MSGQSAKDEILATIRSGKPAPLPMPELPDFPYEGKPVEGFIERLVDFDGKAVKFKNREGALAWLSALPKMRDGKTKVYSTAEGLAGNFPESELENPRNAHKIEICVTEGLLGVGEMGSIWVTGQSLKHAVSALLARELFIFLDSQRIVGGLHEAYSQIKLGDCQYGSFFTGPSATADIEAVHITGAQGPLSLTALIYNCGDAEEPPHLIVNPNADSNKWITVEEEPD